MIQQLILILVGIMLLYQVGILQLDKIISIFIVNGYESDEDCDIILKKKYSHSKHKKQFKESADSDIKDNPKKRIKNKNVSKPDGVGFTPIQSILKNKSNSIKLRGEEILYPWDTKSSNEDSIEDIQSKIMNELNTKELPILTPVAY